MTFKVEAKAITREQAITCAGELEAIIGDIVNGKKKPKDLPIEPMVKLIQFVRDSSVFLCSWLPIDTAPKDGTVFFIRCGQDGETIARFNGADENYPLEFVDTNAHGAFFVNTSQVGEYCIASHWMPLFKPETAVELSGAETDVLYKLYHYGSQDDGDLPSKSGMIGLIEKGLAVKCYDFKHGEPNRLTSKGFLLADNKYSVMVS